MLSSRQMTKKSASPKPITYRLRNTRQNRAVFTKAHAQLDGVVGTDQLPSLSDRSQLRDIGNIDEETTGWRPPSPIGVLHSRQCEVERRWRFG